MNSDTEDCSTSTILSVGDLESALNKGEADCSASGRMIRNSNETSFFSPENGLFTANFLHHSSPSSCILSSLGLTKLDTSVSFADFATSLTSLTFRSFFNIHIE